MAERPRILAFTGPDGGPDGVPPTLAESCAVTVVRNLLDGLASLQTDSFDGLFVSLRDPHVLRRTQSLLQTGAILDVIDDGVAVLNADLRIAWANTIFEKWSGGPAVGRIFFEAIGAFTILGPDHCPFEHALAGQSTHTRIQRAASQILELRVTPLFARDGKVRQIVALFHDITLQASQQQIIDSIHQSANELASLDARQLRDMSVEERAEVLKANIRKLTHDLLHYDVIEIRVLDQDTGRLEPLLAEGMTADAARRVLYSGVDGNGVTGYVAATGRSYICRDASCDPYYIQGAMGARSSVTVAINWDQKVIGTFNVESPKLDGFTDQDVQFTEIFAREVASALHTLELLLVEKQTTTAESIEAISREVALPVDDILTAATTLLDKWIGHEPEMEEKLRVILEKARLVKEGIQRVGENLTPAAKPMSFSSPEIPIHLRGKRILVVDNDERIRRSAHSLLGRFGAIVETARDGKEAVTLAKLSPYDAMLADIRLPDMSGYDIFRLLRQAQPNARVILMTGFGYDPSHALVKARQEGLQHVLYKPFRVEQMLNALDKSPK